MARVIRPDLLVAITKVAPDVRLVQGKRGQHEEQHARERHLRLHRLRHHCIATEKQRLLVLRVGALGALVPHLALGVEPRLRGGGGQLAVGVLSRAELALSGALALVATHLGAAHFAGLGRVAVAAAGLLGGRGQHDRAVGVLARAEHALAARVAFIRVLVEGGAHLVRRDGVAVAAARLDRGGRRGRPQLRAVLGLALLLEHAARIAVGVGQHQAVALIAERRARLHPALAVRRVGVAVAAAGVLGRRRRVLAQRWVVAELPRARRRAVALALRVLLVAHVLPRGAVRLAAARRHRGRGGGRSRRGQLADRLILGQHPLAVLALAGGLILEPEALGLRLVRVAAAAARLLGGGRRRGPQLAAVVALAERLEHAARLPIGIGQHQAVLFGVEGRAALLPTLAVRRVRVDVAAARLNRRRVDHAVHLQHAAADKVARTRALALVATLHLVAAVVGAWAVALAAARLLGRGRRRSRGRSQDAVIVVVGEHPLAALALAAGLIQQLHALVLRLVREAAAAARLLRGGGRGGPHHLAVHVLAERLPRAARHTVRVRQLQALALGVERFAAVHPALAVRRLRVAEAAARLDRGRFHHAVDLEHAVRDEVARARALAHVARLAPVAHVVGARVVALAAAGLLGGRGC